MKVVVTGGAGFLGTRLARRLLQRGTLRDGEGRAHTIERLVLVDVTSPPSLEDARVSCVTGDISDRRVLDRVVDSSTTSVFHLAAIVSGMAEADFDLGMRINVDATRHLLEACRACGTRPTVVFTSSVAVFGGELPERISETTALNPQTSYGIEKAIGELLLADYTRKGFIDGRALRLPTISVRPGRPNAAASSFASGIIREPLNGEDGICPVGPDARMWLASPHTAIESLIAAHELRVGCAGELPVDQRRRHFCDGWRDGRVARASRRCLTPPERVRWQPDPRIEGMVRGWPGAGDNSRALALGFPVDENIDALIRQYMQENSASSAR